MKYCIDDIRFWDSLCLLGTAIAILLAPFLNIGAVWAGPGSESWMLDYAGRSTNELFWDARFLSVVQSSLSGSLSRKVLTGLGGPPNPVFVSGSIVRVSACVAHSCPDKAFFWIDTNSGVAFGARASLWGCDDPSDARQPCELWVGSLGIRSFAELPAAGKRELLQWMDEYQVRVTQFRFVDASGHETPLEAAELPLPAYFHPPATGPSFDCTASTSSIEKVICTDAGLAQSLLRRHTISGVVHRLRKTPDRLFTVQCGLKFRGYGPL